MHTRLWWCHPYARSPACASQGAGHQWKRFHSGSALIGDQANVVTPRPGNKKLLLQLDGCLILLPDSRSAFRPSLEFSAELCEITQSAAAVKPGDNENVEWKERNSCYLTTSAGFTISVWFSLKWNEEKKKSWVKQVWKRGIKPENTPHAHLEVIPATTIWKCLAVIRSHVTKGSGS